MGGQERSVSRFELAESLRASADFGDRDRTARTRGGDERPRLVGQPGIRGIDALKPEQPIFKISGKRIDRDAGAQRFGDRDAEPEERLVGIGFRRARPSS